MTNLSVLPQVADRMLEGHQGRRDRQMAGIAWPIGQGLAPGLSEGSGQTGQSGVSPVAQAYHDRVNPYRP
jgi:hypothetical protein